MSFTSLTHIITKFIKYGFPLFRIFQLTLDNHSNYYSKWYWFFCSHSSLQTHLSFWIIIESNGWHKCITFCDRNFILYWLRHILFLLALTLVHPLVCNLKCFQFYRKISAIFLHSSQLHGQKFTNSVYNTTVVCKILYFCYFGEGM